MIENAAGDALQRSFFCGRMGDGKLFFCVCREKVVLLQPIWSP